MKVGADGCVCCVGVSILIDRCNDGCKVEALGVVGVGDAEADDGEGQVDEDGEYDEEK